MRNKRRKGGRLVCVFAPRWAAAALSAWVSIALTNGCTRAADVSDPPDLPGRTLFLRYCASCHGLDGRGGGPVAASLRRKPADLTSLAARHGGVFDEEAVFAAIDGRRVVETHGPREMPVWGVILEREYRERGSRYPRYSTLLAADVLVEYLRSIQRDSKPARR